MKVALSGARVSQQRLASRVRLLFDHGDTSTLEIIFGARSLDEALVELDSLEHVTSINNDVLAQLEDAKARIGRTSRALDARRRGSRLRSRAGGDDTQLDARAPSARRTSTGSGGSS